jgi:hypothetical protein
MYINLSAQPVQDIPTVDKPDLAMMERAYELFLYGFRDEEVIGLGRHYEKPNFKYLTYFDFKENIGELVEWQANSPLPNACFLPNPMQDNYDQPEDKRSYQKTTVSTTTSPTSKETDFARVCWYLLDLDRVESLKYPAGSKLYSPATPAELTMLANANRALMEFLAGIGFACVLNHHSGNGYGLAVPVHFANGKEVKRKFLAMNKIINDALADFPEVKIDDGFASPRQPWSIPGSLNRKGGRSTLRRALNYDQFTPEDLANSRVSNTMCIEAHLAEAEILTASDLQPKGKFVFNETTSGPQDEMLDFLTQWDNSHCLKEMLVEHGYQLVKDFGHKAFFKRPDKTGPGHGLVVGGERNRLWNWSSSDSTFPVGQLIKPYWAYFLLKGIAKENRIVDHERAKAFYRELGESNRRPYSLEKQVNFSNNELQEAKPTRLLPPPPAALEPANLTPVQPAALEPVGVEPKPRKATGTLADIPLPGIIEKIAQEIMSSNPKETPSIDRTFALSLFQLLIGKSRIYKTGLSCNSYIVNLAPSSAGKESGKTFITKFMEFIGSENEKKKRENGLEEGACCYGFRLLDPSMGSAQGIADEALTHGRILIMGDETERFLHPDENNREGLQTRDLLLRVSTSGLITGRALASGASRRTASNCFVAQIHIIQPKAYFGAFKSDQDTKGFIGRLIHFEASKGVIKRHSHVNPANFSQEITKAGLYWQAENLKGLARKLSTITEKGQTVPSLGRFEPDRLILKASDYIEDKIFEYATYCDDMATKEMEAGNGLMEKFWDKNAEHCIRLASTFTYAVESEARLMTIEAWDLATRLMGLSKQALVNNQGTILKTKNEQLEDDILNHLQQFWAKGESLPATEIWRKFRSRFGQHRLWEEMMFSLASLNIVKIDRATGPGKASFILSKPV